MALDGYSLGDIATTGTGSGVGASNGGSLSLSDIAAGFLSNIAQSTSKGIANIIENKTRSSNTQPLPDLTAVAAKPQVSSFLDTKAFGVSLPILLVGAAALVGVLVLRR